MRQNVYREKQPGAIFCADRTRKWYNKAEKADKNVHYDESKNGPDRANGYC